MVMKIGPTFAAELSTASIPPDGISWDPITGVILACPDAWKTQVAAVLAAHDPTKVPPATQVSFLGFLALFTATEQAAIVNSVDPRIKLFCLMAAGAQYVDLTDPRVVAGTKLLESLDLIASGRAAQVLAGQAPPTV
jgi:hypothetical protein